MPNVTYIAPDGTLFDVELRIGQSLMEGATRNGIPGILAECGGACMCATCHIYVERGGDWLSPITEAENEMLNESAAERRVNSRLGCQIRMVEGLDGLVVRIADNH
ncbi:MAG: 2Fe-2S iron-sulfur cluster-binding protein [Pseudomonadota bacterium]